MFNSSIYAEDSNKLSNIFKSFSNSTKIFTNNISNIKASINIVIDDINSNALTIDNLSALSNSITDKNKQLFAQIDEFNNICTKLYQEVNKFKV